MHTKIRSCSKTSLLTYKFYADVPTKGVDFGLYSSRPKPDNDLLQKKAKEYVNILSCSKTCENASTTVRVK